MEVKIEIKIFDYERNGSYYTKDLVDTGVRRYRFFYAECIPYKEDILYLDGVPYKIIARVFDGINLNHPDLHVIEMKERSFNLHDWI